MSSQLLTKPLPYLALLLASIIWGVNFVVAKITLEEIPPFSLAFLRFFIASIALAPFFLAETKKVKVKKEDLLPLTAAGVFIITLNIAFFFEGIMRTTAIEASVLTLIIPMISILLGWWFLKERVYLINLLGVVMGLIGTIIIIGLPQVLEGSYSYRSFIGNILIILASVSFVIGAVFSRKMLKKYPSLTVTAVAFLVGAITFLPPAVREYFQNPLWVNQVTILGILGLTYMVLLSSISAYFLFEWGLAKTSVAKADLFQYIQPFVAASLAIPLLGETLTFSFLIGTLLIAAGVYLGTFAKEPHHKIHRAHQI